MADDEDLQAMVEPARRIVAFVERGEPGLLDGVFTDDAVLLESVAPYVFEGRAGVAAWAEVMRNHVDDHDGLRAETGRPNELSRSADRAFYSLPVRWSFAVEGHHVDELGAMAILVELQADATWRVARYAWAVAGTTG